MSYEMLGMIAGIIAISGYIPYIYSILKGQTRPNRATWFIWTIVGGLLAFSYMAEGDQHSIWLPLGYFFGPLITAILSLRLAMRNGPNSIPSASLPPHQYYSMGLSG